MIILLAVLFLPYWFYLPLILLGILIFSFFWEGILFGFLIDVLYGWGVTALPSLVAPTALSALVLIIILLPVRERLRFHV